MAGEPHLWLKAKIEEAAEINAFPIDITGDDEPPYAVYVRESTASEKILEDDLEEVPDPDEFPATASFTVTIWAAKYVDAWALARLVYLAIDKFRDLEGDQTIHSVFVTDKRDGEIVYFEGREQPFYSVELSVEIQFTED